MSKRVLMFHYDLTDNQGRPIDSSRGGEPFPVMEGSRQILPALEAELFGMKTGEKKRVALEAARAYGPRNEQLKVTVSRSKLPQGDIQVGSQFRGGNDKAELIFTVTAIDGDKISLDGNHALAGQDLVFDVEVTEIREATEEELSHGHAHGPHGHGHDH